MREGEEEETEKTKEAGKMKGWKLMKDIKNDTGGEEEREVGRRDKGRGEGRGSLQGMLSEGMAGEERGGQRRRRP